MSSVLARTELNYVIQLAVFVALATELVYGQVYTALATGTVLCCYRV